MCKWKGREINHDTGAYVTDRLPARGCRAVDGGFGKLARGEGGGGADWLALEEVSWRGFVGGVDAVGEDEGLVY